MNARHHGWILCPSKSFPGKFYYFNVIDGKAAWSLDDAESQIIEKPDCIPRETLNHQHPEPSSPPIPEPVRNQAPPPFTSMNPTPVYSQSVVWTPIQIQVPILLPNEAKYNYTGNTKQDYPKHWEIKSQATRRECKDASVQACLFSGHENSYMNTPEFYTSTPKQSNLFPRFHSKTNLSFADLSSKFENKKPTFNLAPPSLPEEIETVQDYRPNFLEEKSSSPVSRSVELSDNDLRKTLLTKRKWSDSTDANIEDTATKQPRQTHLLPKKRVSFNLDNEYEGLDDDEDINLEKEKRRSTLKHLKDLADPEKTTEDQKWYIVTDAEVLMKEYGFIEQFVQIDATCKLLVPASVFAELSAEARGSGDRASINAARNAVRRLHNVYVVVQSTNETNIKLSAKDDIMNCCIETMDNNIHLVLITNDPELHDTAKQYQIHCYSLNSIKNGLAKPQYQKMKITIKNPTDSHIQTDSAKLENNEFDNNVLNEKEKEIIRNLKRLGNDPRTWNINSRDANINLRDPNIHSRNPNETSTTPNINLNSAKPNETKNDSTVVPKYTRNPNENLTAKAKIYSNESLRIANAIPISPIDSRTNTYSTNAKENHQISNISTIPNISVRNVSTTNKSMREFSSTFPSAISKETHQTNISGSLNESVRNISTTPNKSMLEFSNSVTNQETSNQKRQYASDIEETADKDIENVNLKEKSKKGLNSTDTVSVFFQKPTSDVQKFKNFKQKITFKNSTLSENDIKQPHYEEEPRKLEMREANNSIFEFCKEKPEALKHSTFEFQNGKSKMAAVSFEQSKSNLTETPKSSMACTYETPKSNMAPTYDTPKSNMAPTYETSKSKMAPTHETSNSNMASSVYKSKSNMASSVCKSNMAALENIKSRKILLNRNKIDLSEFVVKNKVMDNRLRDRIEEYVCSYKQIMEEALSSVLEKLSHSVLKTMRAPWSLLEALQCTKTVYKEHTPIIQIVDTLCTCLYDRNDKLKKDMTPEDFMKSLGCGIRLLEYLKKILLPSIGIQDGETSLQALFKQIEDEYDYQMDLNDPLVKAPARARSDDLTPRQNFVKHKSEIRSYLIKHFSEWKDYKKDKFSVVRTLGKVPVTLERRDDSRSITDANALDRNVEEINERTCSKIGKVKVRSDLKLAKSDFGNHNCDKNGVMNERNVDGTNDGNFVKNVTANNEAKPGNSNNVCEKEPKIVRSANLMAEYENRLRNRKLNKQADKSTNVQTKQDKKSNSDTKSTQIDIKTNEKAKNDKQIDTAKTQDKYPERCSPQIIVNANLIKYFEEKLKKKAVLGTELYNNTSLTDDNNDKTRRKSRKTLNNDDANNDRDKTENYDNKALKDTNKTLNNDKNATKEAIHLNVTEPTDHNVDNDEDCYNKDVMTNDSGLGKESPRFYSVVETFLVEMEESLEYIQKYINGSIEDFKSGKKEGCKATFRLKAFETQHLITHVMLTMKRIRKNPPAADTAEERVRNAVAVSKFFVKAKIIYKLVNLILSVTSDRPVSSSMSSNATS